ncbi:MAG: M56 family metallopeptidase [Tenuifilaceae bacterium]|jgi:TonB family protein|nr:M56 family metallopeptidase [Tenuifilaceae bacterium]
MEASNLISIFLKIGISLAIVWLIWYALLRNVNRFAAVRAFLVVGAAISVLTPWIIPQIQSAFTLPASQIGVDYIFNIPAVAFEGDIETHLSWQKVIIWLYLAISGFFLIRLGFQLVKIFLLIKQNAKHKKEGMYIVEHGKEVSPFSFFNFCFINPSHIPADKLDGVIQHEREHFHKFHSADILIMEIIGVTQWFNPFYWMLRSAMVEVHEYQADNGAIRAQSDPNSYLDSIVSIAFYGVALPIGNNFNKSLTLKRLAMMNITKKTKGALLRLALALTVALPVVLAISCDSNKSEDEQQIKEEEVVIKLEAKDSKEVFEGDIFVVVEDMPQFQGEGLNKFREYISEKLIYPEIAKDNGIQGRVILSFVVEPNGTVSNVKILRGVDPSLDQEAVRVVESSPLWTPGTQKGEAVRVVFNIPIIFALQ